MAARISFCILQSKTLDKSDHENILTEKNSIQKETKKQQPKTTVESQ